MKFELIGTTCAGKSTLTFEVIAKLKRLGILVEGVFQQDRRLAFERNQLETEKSAQYWMIFNQMSKEIELSLRKGTEHLVSDRSVLDFYAYYEEMYGRDETLWNTVKWWCKTYDSIYYLEPLKYQDDNSRPSDEFRMKVDKVLNKLIKEVPNVKKIKREEIYSDILKQIDRILTPEEISQIPKILKQKVIISGSYAFNRQTKTSDVDVYLLGKKFRRRPDLQEMMRYIYGVYFDITEVDKTMWKTLLMQGNKVSK